MQKYRDKNDGEILVIHDDNRFYWIDAQGNKRMGDGTSKWQKSYFDRFSLEKIPTFEDYHAACNIH